MLNRILRGEVRDKHGKYGTKREVWGIEGSAGGKVSLRKCGMSHKQSNIWLAENKENKIS